MRTQALDAAMQALAAIDLCDAVYVACPVSSGIRELDLMRKLSRFDRDDLRRDYADEWRATVLEPNKADARAAAADTRRRFAGRSVIDPSTFQLDGLDQHDYDELCERIIRRHVGTLVLADGWRYSRGARVEAVLALTLGLPVEDGAGRKLSEQWVLGALDSVHDTLHGFPPGLLGELFPELSLGTDHSVHGLQFQ